MLTALTLASALLISQSPAPSVDISSLMNFKIFAQDANPRMTIGHVDIAFVPSGDFAVRAEMRSGQTTVAKYVPVDITRAGTMARIRFRGNNVVSLSADGSLQSFIVYVDEKIAGKLEFKLGKTTTGDAFNPTNEFTFSGPWQTHAVLDYSDGPGSTDGVAFGYWMTSLELGPQRTYNLDLVMRRGTTIIATANSQSNVRGHEPQYRQILLQIKRSHYLNAAALKNLNGPFVLELKSGEQVVRSYRGEIENGKFRPHPNSSLSYEDPTKFLPFRIISSRVEVAPTLRTWLTTN